MRLRAVFNLLGQHKQHLKQHAAPIIPVLFDLKTTSNGRFEGCSTCNNMPDPELQHRAKFRLSTIYR